ncbi:DUF3298 and DUF4163 domain-containing protein [Patescibacteria group bacterium]|nr:DUF3298 and DUF4163 domain-containing protein [Patescibacteria group bacterium]
MSFPKTALSIALLLLPVMGGGCRFASLLNPLPSTSSSAIPPVSTSTVEGIPVATSTQIVPISGAVGTIVAYRGGFIDGQETVVWVTRHETLPGYPGTFAGRFSEVKTGRSGVIVQDPIEPTSSSGDTFTFSVLLDSLKEGESVTGTAMYVLRSDGGEFYQGTVNVNGKDQAFTLARAPSLPSFDLIQFSTSTAATVGNCEYSVRYPQIRQADFLDNSQKSTINTKIVQLVQMGTSTFSEQATEFIESCQAELKDLSEMDDEVSSDMTYVVDNSVQVSSATPNVLSLILLNYVYSGGAHGIYGYESFNLRIPSGQALTLSELVKPDQLKEFTKLVSRKLLAQNEEYLFPESVSDIKAFIKDTTPLSPEQQREQYGRQGNWYLTDGGITFFYNPYEIASYAAGIQEVSLVFPSWRKMALPAAFTQGLLP